MTRPFTDADVPDQRGRVVLVTGANTGIGHEAALVLASRGARVLLGCRSLDRGQDALDRIRRRVPDADVVLVLVDLGDLSSIADAAAAIAAHDRPLDVLVHNAGVMAPPYGQTVDGFETQFGVNHLGTFALTGHLLPTLVARTGSRIVVTSSIAHRSGRLLLDDLAAARSYDAMARYRQSKLANLLFALELDRRLRAADAATAAVACHPGIAVTELARHIAPAASWLLPVVRPVLQLRWNSARQGAWPTLMAATDPGVVGGEYLGPTGRGEIAGPAGRARIAGHARDQQLATALWDVSVEMTGIDPGV